MPDRLFLGANTAAEWRQAAQTTHQARLARLTAQADSYLDTLPPAEHPRETITYIGMAVANLALAHLLTDDERYLAAARRWIATAIAYPHWGRANLPDHDLDAGWLCFGLALGYRWLDERLPPAERDALVAKLLLQGQRLDAFARERAGEWWSSAYWQNHNWICWTGLATAGFALRPEHPETKAWTDAALANFRAVLALMPEDGSDYEGPVYWNYGVPWLYIACDLLRQETGVDLHDNGFLRNTFFYRLYASAPNLVDTANFGDCHDRRSAHSAALCYRVASLYRNGYAQWLADHFERTGEWEREGREGLLRPGLLPQAFLEFLWYDPTVATTPIAGLPLVRAFPDLGLVSARTGWTPDATFLAFKCGAPSGHKAWTLGHAINRQREARTLKPGHAHPDENSFILIRGDDYLAVDEGYSKEKQSRHHSTVLVDGQGQYQEGAYDVFAGLGPDWGGRLERWFTGASITYARGEAAAAYDPALGLRRFTRQSLLLDDAYLVLCDDLEAAAPRDFTWLLQTDAPARRLAPGHFRVEVGGTTLDIWALAPPDPEWVASDEEIVAYPSSSTPEWVLRHIQHLLALKPRQATSATRFLVVLALTPRVPGAIPPVSVRSLAGADGRVVELARQGHRRLVGFAAEARGIGQAGPIATDGSWITADLAGDDRLASLAAGDAAQVWATGQLRFSSASPAAVAMDDGGWRWRLGLGTAAWVSLWVPGQPAAVTINDEPAPVDYDASLLLARLHLPAGEADVRFQQETTS